MNVPHSHVFLGWGAATHQARSAVVPVQRATMAMGRGVNVSLPKHTHTHTWKCMSLGLHNFR